MKRQAIDVENFVNVWIWILECLPVNTKRAYGGILRIGAFWKPTAGNNLFHILKWRFVWQLPSNGGWIRVKYGLSLGDFASEYFIGLFNWNSEISHCLSAKHSCSSLIFWTNGLVLLELWIFADIFGPNHVAPSLVFTVCVVPKSLLQIWGNLFAIQS